MLGETLIGNEIEYLNCQAGDNAGRFRVNVDGKAKIFDWDSISRFEFQALSEAIEHVNKNKLRLEHNR